MSSVDLAARIAEEAASLPPDKQSAVLDFVMFVKERAAAACEEDGDAAWERILSDPRPLPKLEAFFKQAEAEGGEEPLDLDRL